MTLTPMRRERKISHPPSDMPFRAYMILAAIAVVVVIILAVEYRLLFIAGSEVWQLIRELTSS